ncbi:hypothetical protein ACFQDG_13330 [Natronoarchaeum mannanilyticum]|uniref:Uncharacterized protein n=1 Tax=Natronoarchaeum mannanilyticum TaxID=926360 RepID=A0AAV3T5Z1_9EURY
MDKYIAAISGVQMTVVGGFLALLLEGDGTVGLVAATAMLLGTMLVATTAYDDLQSR